MICETTSTASIADGAFYKLRAIATQSCEYNDDDRRFEYSIVIALASPPVLGETECRYVAMLRR